MSSLEVVGQIPSKLPHPRPVRHAHQPLDTMLTTLHPSNREVHRNYDVMSRDRLF